MLLLLILWRMGELLTSWQQHKNRSVQIRLLTERTCTEYDSLSLSLCLTCNFAIVFLPTLWRVDSLSPSHSLDYCCSFSHCCCCCCQRSGVTDFAAARQRHSRGRLLPLLSMRLCVCVCACNAYVHTCVRACVSVCACAYQRE